MKAEPDKDDPRFTIGLLYDLGEVLKRHGYTSDTTAEGASAYMLAALELARAFEHGKASTR